VLIAAHLLLQSLLLHAAVRAANNEAHPPK
jgi:hypothetical protein